MTVHITGELEREEMTGIFESLSLSVRRGGEEEGGGDEEDNVKEH